MSAMHLAEHVALASHTTLHIGGEARYFSRDADEAALLETIQFARAHALPLRVLGAGSNVLVPDTGIECVVVRLAPVTAEFAEQGTIVTVRAGAGMYWDDVVRAAGERDLYGIENLAGIPGTVGGAAVQNIGAYGAELSTSFLFADTVHRVTGERRRVSRAEAEFGYRTSLFKQDRSYIVTHVGFELHTHGTIDCSYADLARAKDEGVVCDTPRTCAEAVRAIRARKFPNTSEGSAGSFFKNPVLSREDYAVLTQQYPDLPGFPQTAGTVKISLAWILDHVLGLKGFAVGSVRLFEKQPLILVTQSGARADDVDAFASDIAERVRTATGIIIEREVETFSA